MNVRRHFSEHDFDAKVQFIDKIFQELYFLNIFIKYLKN
jgi:hypothetical protein